MFYDMTRQEFAKNVFPSEHWQLLTTLEKLAGHWPYQNEIKNRLIQLLHTIFLLSMAFVFVARVPNEMQIKNYPIIIEATLCGMTCIGIAMKLFILSIKKVTKTAFYDSIIFNWNNKFSNNEISKLNEYACIGYKIGFVYVVGLLLGMVLYQMPLIKLYVEYCLSDNKTYFKKQPYFYTEYFVDQNDYFYEIITHTFLVILSGAVVNVTHDLAYIMTVGYVCGSFKIIVSRLNEISNIIKEAESATINFTTADYKLYSFIRSIIDLHHVTLRAVTYIENMFNLIWCVIIIMQVATFGAILLIIVTHNNDVSDIIRYVFIFIVFIIHFFIIFWSGQLVNNSSISVYNACCNCQWYKLSKRCKLLIYTMIIRSSKYCFLTGGNIFLLNIETFAKLLKTALSYFTVFASMQ